MNFGEVGLNFGEVGLNFSKPLKEDTKVTMELIENKISDFGETLSMNTRVALRLSYLKSCDLRLP